MRAAAVGRFFWDRGFTCPVLTLNDDKNICGAALGLAANMGENIKQNHLGLFAPVENRECFSIAGRGLRWIVSGRQEAHGETQ